jgi:glycerol uptake operon antiterminator
MEYQQFLDEIITNPVIAAIRGSQALEKALASPVKTVFLLAGSINNIVANCRQVLATGRNCFIHVDLLEGMRPDQQGLAYLAAHAAPTGVITTKAPCVKWAQSLGLLTVQRVFLLDSTALQEGSRHIEACRPDLVEVMPGVAEKVVQLAVHHFHRPLIAGGLISSREEVYAALKAGALAVSTSEPDLWWL